MKKFPRFAVAAMLLASLLAAQSASCGISFSTLPTNDPSTGQAGIMFNIQNVSAYPITICGAEINIDQTPSTVTIEFWKVTAGTSWVGKSTQAALWTRHHRATGVTSSGNGVSPVGNPNPLTPIPNFPPLVLNAGQTLGIVIATFEGTYVNYKGLISAPNVAQANDGTLKSYTGIGKSWNGVAGINGTPFGIDLGSGPTSSRGADVRFGYVTGCDAAFTASTASGTASLSVSFADTSTQQGASPITSWAWDFDGDSVIDSTLQHPTFVYTSAGTYSPSLTVSTGTAAGTSTYTATNLITVLPPPPVITLTVGSTATTTATTTHVEYGLGTAPGDAAVGNAATNEGTLTYTDVAGVGTCPTISTITRTWSATSANGTTTLVQTILIEDTTAPTITTASLNLNPSSSLDSTCLGVVPDFRDAVRAVSTDTYTSSASLTISQVPAAGSSINQGGPHAVVVTVTDGCNTSTSVTYTVQYTDAAPPSITAPSDYSLRSNPVVNEQAVSFGTDGGSATASDDCDASVTITYAPASGSMFVLGTHVVTATATDDGGNTASATFDVSIVFDWTAITDIASGIALKDIAIADMTGDGHLDAVVGGGTSVALYAGDGAGGLTLLSTASITGDLVRLATHDVNADGYVDVAVASNNSGTSRLTVLLGTTTGIQGTPHFESDLTTTVPSEIAMLDLGGGLSGVVVTARGLGTPVSGAGTTLVTLAATPTSASLGADAAWDVTTADLDDDGDLDLVVAEETVLRLWTNASGTFTSAGTLAAPATTSLQHVVAADFDGDGEADDVAACGPTTASLGLLAVYSNAATSGPVAARFAAPTTRTSTTYASMTDLTVADLQSDGVADDASGASLRVGLDLLAANDGAGSGADAVAVSRFDGAALETFAAITMAGGPAGAAAGDLDGNGIVDLLVANTDGTLRVLLAQTRALGTPFGVPYPAASYTYIPHITSDPMAIMGTTASVNLTGARPFSGGMLACSTSSMLTEVSGVGSGTNLYLGFPIYILPSLAGVIVNGSGEASISFAIHPTLFMGERLHFQWAVFDGSTAAGYALTEGLLLRVGR